MRFKSFASDILQRIMLKLPFAFEMQVAFFLSFAVNRSGGGGQKRAAIVEPGLKIK